MESELSWGLALFVAVASGAVMIPVGFLIRSLAERGADGRLGRNRLAGTRTKATLASDEAWLVGHQAALKDHLTAGTMSFGTAVVPVVLAGLLALIGLVEASGFMMTWVILFLAGTALVVWFAFAGLRKANEAAGSVGEDT